MLPPAPTPGRPISLRPIGIREFPTSQVRGEQKKERDRPAMKYGNQPADWARDGGIAFPLLENIKSWCSDGVEIPCFGFDEPRYKKLNASSRTGLHVHPCVWIVSTEPTARYKPAVRQAAVDVLKSMIDQNRTVAPG